MKIGIAKFDAGIDTRGRYQPVRPEQVKVKNGMPILKGIEYYVKDTYDFKHKGAIFEEKKSKDKKE